MPSKEVFTLCTPFLYCYQKTRLLNMVEKEENNAVYELYMFLCILFYAIQTFCSQKCPRQLQNLSAVFLLQLLS